MDEFSTILRARQLANEAGVNSAPVDIQKYLKVPSINAVLRVDYDLLADQAGSTTLIKDRHCIFVNGCHSRERQRFTVLHEIGHIVLNIPSSHSKHLKTQDLYSYRKKPKEEILCDVFAAELLLPEALFRQDVLRTQIGFDGIETLASNYETSLTSTGSRFAVLNEEPCAFILSEAGKVRYVSYSRDMREQKSWISIGLTIPNDTLTVARLKGHKEEGPVEIEAHQWLENETRKGRYILEDVRLLEQWNQSLTLIWFENAEYREHENSTQEEYEEEPGLQELDGSLPWPSKRRRR